MRVMSAILGFPTEMRSAALGKRTKVDLPTTSSIAGPTLA